MLPEKIIYISFLISFFGYFFYFKDIFRGNTRPNMVSWIVWMSAPFIGVYLQLKAGAGLSVVPVFLAGFGPFLVVAISAIRKNTFWHVTKLDIWCGIFALLSLIFYVLTRNPGLAIIFAITGDGLAAVPTIVKSWKFPETENSGAYFPGVINGILGLLVIREWKFAVYSFNIYLIVTCLIIIFFIYRKKIFTSQCFTISNSRE